MSKKFSILITTRYRTDFLKNLLESIHNTSFYKEDIEVLIIYDIDDNQTDIFAKNFNLDSQIQFSFYKRERSMNLVNDYHNYYAKNYANGKYLIFSNDDALFEMPEWDKRILNRLNTYEEMYPDGILYGITEDFENEPKRHAHNWMACFPLITKKHIEILGYAFDPEFIRDGADWALAALYRSIDRIVDLRDCCIIKHLSLRSRRRKEDILDRESRKLGILPPSMNVFVKRDSEILLEYINNFYQKE